MAEPRNNGSTRTLAFLGGIVAVIAPMGMGILDAKDRAMEAIREAHDANERAAQNEKRFEEYRATVGERLATLEQATKERIPSEMDLRLKPLSEHLDRIEARWEEWLPKWARMDTGPPR